MSFSGVGKKFLFLISVPTCVSCKKRLSFDDVALCPSCESNFAEIKTRNCSKCAKPLHECSCTTEVLRSHFIKSVVKCFRYNVREETNPGNALIYSLKRDNRSDVLERCTKELVFAIRNSVQIDDSFVVTNVPRRQRSIIKYGFDHSALLAESVSRKLDIPYIKMLKSKAKSEQKKLSPEERLKNVDFRLITDESLKGKNVIIVDDIITTGASASGASTMIRSLSPKGIIAASLAIAYRDD